MGVVRLSRSGLQVQFVSDEGDVFVCSRSFLLRWLVDRGGVGVVLLSRLPFRLSRDRFRVSPVWDRYGGGVVPDESLGGDVLSRGFRVARDEVDVFRDREV